MAQRALTIPGLVIDAPDARRIEMSLLDTAIARIPGLVTDLDASRLVSPETGFLGRARGNGALLQALGTGYSVVTSANLNNKTAIRLDGETGHHLPLLKGISTQSYSFVFIGTLASYIRNTNTANSRGLVSVYSGTSPTVWIRIAPTTGNLVHSNSSSLSASVAKASLPDADVPAIYIFTRHHPANNVRIHINGTQAASATESTAPAVSEVQPINIGGVDAVTSNRSFSGDVARVVAYNSDIVLNYPEFVAELVAAAKVEFGIS